MAQKKKAKGGADKKATGGSRGKWIAATLFLLLGVGAGWLLLRPAQVLVPSLVGKTEAEARAQLEKVGLSVVVTLRPATESSQAGKVMAQEPASGTALPRMGVVTLLVGEGAPGIELPDLSGKTRSEAEDLLIRLGLKVEFQEEASEDVPIGRVIRHQPAAGETAAPATVVLLVVSGGVGDIVLPDFVGWSLEEARAELERLGLRLDVAQVAQEGFQEGDPVRILRQEPAAGQRLMSGAKVLLFLPIPAPTGGPAVGNGSSATHAPRFEGLTVAAAKKLAQEQGVILELADAAEETQVITFQDPPPGDPLQGKEASVVIRVADSSVVPSLYGLDEAQARAALERAGLTLGAIKRSHGEISGEVLDQRPSAGIEVVAGSRVDLVVSDPQAAPGAALAPAPTPGFTPAPWVE